MPMENLDYDYLAELVERAREHDSDAFAELYAATYQRCYRFASQYLKDADLAQDALQETYILVFKNISALNDQRLFVSWIDQILFRVCFRMQKKNEKFRLANLTPLENEASTALENGNITEQLAISIDQRSFLARQIMGLPSSESQSLIHFYYDGMTIAQIAKLMNISQSSVKRYLAAGRKKLARLVER